MIVIVVGIRGSLAISFLNVTYTMGKEWFNEKKYESSNLFVWGTIFPYAKKYPSLFS